MQMAERAAGKLDLHKPAIRPEAFPQSGVHGTDLARKKSGGIHEMAGVGENEVAALVLLGIALRFAGGRADQWNRLQVVRHRIAVSRVAIPGLECEHFAEFLADEAAGEGDAGIESA